MRLLAIELRNVRRFIDPVRIDGIADGLNVLCEPNESGKSTVFDAVQALFFVPHRSQAKEVKALRPHAGGGPEVAVELEAEEGRFRLWKRWLARPEVQVRQDGRLLAQADEAEAWIARLLGGDGDGGPSGLLWVRQGMTALDGGSVREQDAALEARRNLLSSVTGEVEAMTGGRKMDAALARCREELEGYATGTGRPKAGGPWKAALDEADALRRERDRLTGVADELAEALERRRIVRRELAELENPAEAEARRTRLDAARRAYEAAERHAEAVARAADAYTMAELKVARAESDLARLREARDERTRASSALEAARAEREATAAALREAEARQAGSAVTARQASETLAAAQAALRAALRREAARDGARRRDELRDKIVLVEAAREKLETAAAAAKVGPDADALRRIEALAQDLRAAERLRDASSAHVVMSYTAGAEGCVRLDGRALEHEARVPIKNGATLDLPGLGWLAIHPGQIASDDSVETVGARLAKALSAVGAENLEAAHRTATTRQDAERVAGEAKATLEALAPDGVEALRAALAAIPEADPGADGPASDDAQAALSDAEAASAEAARIGETDRRACDGARDRAARAEAAEAAAAARLDRAEAACGSEDAEAGERDLAEGLVRLRSDLEAAATAHRELAAAAPDFDAVRAALHRAQSVVEEAERRGRELASERDRLDERIDVRSGEAVEEELADVEAKFVTAEARLDRIEFEVRVLTRLKDALEAARADARERYFEPVMRELAPLLRLLWPEAELVFDERTLLPVAFTRAGKEEGFDVLSGGTREQIALLVRLAFARMLAARGRHAPVILDDALVYTDDDRIERMFDALHRQAADLQIIVFSCRQRAFRDLGGRALRFVASEEVVA